MLTTSKPTKVIVATRSKHLAFHIDRQFKCLGLLTTTGEPTLESLVAAIGESEPALVVVDATEQPITSMTLVKQLSDVRPNTRTVVLSRSADLELVARAVIMGASQFLLQSDPFDQCAKAFSDVIAGRPPSEDGLFGRIYAAFPARRETDGMFLTHSGRLISTNDAIKLCDQFGLTVDETASFLNISIDDVERVTEDARKIVKPSLISRILSAILPVDGDATPLSSRKSMLAIAGLLVGVTSLSGLFGSPVSHVAYARISGTLLYDDGSPIPGDRLRVRLLATGLPQEKAKGERPADFIVDWRTGEFAGVICYLRSNARPDMNYKAVVLSAVGKNAPDEQIPIEYGDPHATPLNVNIHGGSLALRVRKPVAKPSKSL